MQGAGVQGINSQQERGADQLRDDWADDTVSATGNKKKKKKTTTLYEAKNCFKNPEITDIANFVQYI